MILSVLGDLPILLLMVRATVADGVTPGASVRDRLGAQCAVLLLGCESGHIACSCSEIVEVSAQDQSA